MTDIEDEQRVECKRQANPMSKLRRRSIGEYLGNSEGTHAERHWRRSPRIGGQPRWLDLSSSLDQTAR
jgi:hypothetical protein